MPKWIIKADNEVDFDTNETLFWCNEEGWVLQENCQRFSAEEKERYPFAVLGGKWICEEVSS